MKKSRLAEFEKLCAIEPCLAALLERARAVKDDTAKPSFCANRIWYGELKPELTRLVGRRRKDHPVLGTPRAYDLSYQIIYDALPACRDCACWGFAEVIQDSLASAREEGNHAA